MAEPKVSNTITTNLSSVDYQDSTAKTATDFLTINPQSLDSAGVGTETGFNIDFEKWTGYYKEVPEYKSVVDTLVKWALGKGLKKVPDKLKRIVGNGKETCRMVLMNQVRVAIFAGDSFAEVTKDKAGRIVNVKPINPKTIKTIYNENGIIIRYEQWIGNELKTEFDLDKIFHLQFCRVADEMHGTPLGEVLEKLLLARSEAMEDQRILFHRFVKPLRVFYANTDDTSELEALEAKIAEAYKKTENLVLPKGSMELGETTSIPQYSNLSPLEWIRHIVRLFTTACGVPEIILGWGENTTEASAKVIYVAWQQTIEDLQKWIEEMVEMQLGVEIELEFPVDLAQNLEQDQSKDGKTKATKKGDIEAKI